MSNNIFTQTKGSIVVNDKYDGDFVIETLPAKYSLLKDTFFLRIIKNTDKCRLYYKLEIDSIGQISILEVFFRPSLNLDEEQYKYLERYFKFKLIEDVSVWKSRSFFTYNNKGTIVISIQCYE